MKVGPVHVVTESTMQEMQSLMHRYFRGMHEAAAGYVVERQVVAAIR